MSNAARLVLTCMAFGSIDSSGSTEIEVCLHHSLLKLSFENLCSQWPDTLGTGPISPSPLSLYLTQGSGDIWGQLDDSSLQGTLKLLCPKAKRRIKDES